MIAYYITIPLLLAAALFLGIFLQKKKGGDIISRIIRISAIVFIAFMMLNNFLPDFFVRSQRESTLAKLEGTDAAFHAVLRWLNSASFIVIPLAVFQKSKYFEKIATYFCLPVAIVNFACTYQYINYYITPVLPDGSGLQTLPFASESFKNFLVNEGFRLVFIGIICLSQLIALSFITFKNLKNLKLAKNDALPFALILLGSIYIALPTYATQYLFGWGSLKISSFSALHFVWIFAIVGIIVGFYFLFRNKSYDAKHHFLIALAWALMMQYSQFYTASGNLGIDSIPLQLCNLGAYLALIMLITKNEKLFHFTLIVNVVGALIAIMILDIGEGQIFRIWTVHFIVAHTKVLVIPILALVLKIFKPIDKKMIKHFSIGFSMYFLLILVLGSICGIFYRVFADPALSAIGKETPMQQFFYYNDLYMFDKQIAGDLVGFTDPLFDIGKITIGSLEISPLVVLFVYVVFMAFCLSIAFFIYWLTRNQRKNNIEYVVIK